MGPKRPWRKNIQEVSFFGNYFLLALTPVLCKKYLYNFYQIIVRWSSFNLGQKIGPQKEDLTIRTPDCDPH